MSILQTLGNGQGYLRAGVLGFNKSGKSWTSILLLIAVKRMLKLDGPIVMYDTEGGSEYLAPVVKKLTGAELVGVRARSFSDLVEAAKEAEQIGAAGFLADSITHPWRELCDSHLREVNERRARGGLPPRSNLVMKDWNVLKGTWNDKWAVLYLNMRVHNIVAGRAGFDYEHVEDAESGEVEIKKSGVKMKTESEFGYEPSLLIEMERLQDRTGESPVIVRRATVLGDRFNVLDGRSREFRSLGDAELELAEVADFFGPHLAMLVPGSHAPVDTESHTQVGADVEGDHDWSREKKTRQILAEEIQGLLVSAYPGQSKEEKKAKADLMQTCFNTRSWTKIENMPSAEQRAGMDRLYTMLATAKRDTLAAEPEQPGQAAQPAQVEV